MCRALLSWPGYAVMAMVPCAVRCPAFIMRNLLEDGEGRKDFVRPLTQHLSRRPPMPPPVRAGVERVWIVDDGGSQVDWRGSNFV
ncbi:hypothetical protein C8Q76DRAFT_338287 [Earliella scabrosa]|nr:hypothetical protein C8Q76DRAFT_338287 [Earliella scabrosa]